MSETKKFDPKALAALTRTVQVKTDPVLGEIRFGILNFGEFQALNLDSVTDVNERVAKVVFAMLKKADPSLTIEDFNDFPFSVKSLLMQSVSEETG